MNVRACFIILCALFVTNASAAQNITIETQSSNLFENIVTDTYLLLDSNLQEKLSPYLAHIGVNSVFTVKSNSWIPKPNPKNTLLREYSNINVTNLNTSFASLIQPVIELACAPQVQDPFNELSSKCIKALFSYPIVQPIGINYNYNNTANIEQVIGEVSGGLDDIDRYKRIIRAMADIMNSSFEIATNNNIKVSLNFTKYPLDLVKPYSIKSTAPNLNTRTKKSTNLSAAAASERAKLEKKLDKLENSTSSTLNTGNGEKDKMVEDTKKEIQKLEDSPDFYVQNKKYEREAYAERIRKANLREDRNARREGRGAVLADPNME